MQAVTRWLLALGLPATLVLAAEPPAAVTKENVRTFYRDFKRLTEHPRVVAPLTALGCRMPDQEVLDRERKLAGPHWRALIHVYANGVAAEAIRANSPTLPVGATIIKEKLDEKKAVVEVGGMIKRAPGYDAANGDWEFFFSSKSGEFATGKLANCIDCHVGGKRDHVFSVWPVEKRPSTVEPKPASAGN
jgi:hypothetical protein